jgi:hypothetical protein
MISQGNLKEKNDILNTVNISQSNQKIKWVTSIQIKNIKHILREAGFG